jgi:hypothetical protein
MDQRPPTMGNIVDCSEDDSDEQNCSLYERKQGYKESTPPRGIKRAELNVKVSIQVNDIISIMELNFEYRVRVKVTMEWFDDRITFRNLRDEDEKNVILMDDQTGLWFPMLEFSNSNEGLRTIYDMEAHLVAKRIKPGKHNGIVNIHEDQIYPGTENPLSLTRFYTITLQCLFDLTMLPFDKQLCDISLSVPFNMKPYINIVLHEASESLPITMIQYKYRGLENNTSLPASDEMTVHVKMERIFISYLATIFLPSLCRIAIGQLTLFIDVQHFEATIMVALTSMLVMYTLYQSITSILPETAYLNLIDIWLVAGLILPFFIFMVLIVVDNCTLIDTDMVTRKVKPLQAWEKTMMSQEKKRRGLTVLRWSQFLFPIFTTVFVLIFMVIAVNSHYYF